MPSRSVRYSSYSSHSSHSKCHTAGQADHDADRELRELATQVAVGP